MPRSGWSTNNRRASLGARDAPHWRIDSGLNVGIEHGVPTETIAASKARGHDMPQADRWSTDFDRAQLIYKLAMVVAARRSSAA